MKSPVLADPGYFASKQRLPWRLLGKWWQKRAKFQSAPPGARRPVSVFVIDLKGHDFALYSSLEHAAAIARKRLRIELPLQYFSNEIGAPTFAWNPLRQSFLKELSISQLSDILATGMGVAYGGDYGPGATLRKKCPPSPAGSEDVHGRARPANDNVDRGAIHGSAWQVIPVGPLQLGNPPGGSPDANYVESYDPNPWALR